VNRCFNEYSQYGFDLPAIGLIELNGFRIVSWSNDAIRIVQRDARHSR
jgi:hypothetical protein